MTSSHPPIHINAAFDGGNIRRLRSAGDSVDLEIVHDKDSDFFQWFFFRAAGVAGRTTTYRIVNAGAAAYAFGWPGYRTRVSTDLNDWRTTDTRYADGVLSFTHDGSSDLVWFAFFAPYTMERHHALVARMAGLPGVRHRELGQTLDGQPLDLLTLGTGATPVWLYARQHPGETMAEWWMEGALEKLTDPADATALALREMATFHIVPNMNPDGSRRGHLRTNAAGVNLNREWAAPSMAQSPEVFLVRAEMERTGVAFAMDVHGDEAIPANFIAGFEGIPNWTDALGERFYVYRRALAAATPDFQVEKGYPRSAPGKANLAMSTNQLANWFGAVAMTLEMPFKDHDTNPDPLRGWSPDRCKTLAHACLDTLAEMIGAV